MNRHLNVFVPYTEIPAGHEDQLTRAAMIVVRLVPAAREALLRLVGARGLAELSGVGEVDMQTRHVAAGANDSEEVELAELVSVFLTPDTDRPAGGNAVTESERRQRLDGVVRFEPDLVVVVESKVWERADEWQSTDLHLGAARFGDTRRCNLRWQDLLEAWRRLVDHGLLAPAEELLIQDLFDFAEEHFAQVLPFTTLRRAGADPGRRSRRLRALLQEVTGLRPEDRGGHVRLDQPPLQVRSMQRAQLDEEHREIVLRVWPGELKPQAEWLYDKGRAQRLAELDSQDGWQLHPTPHLAFYTAPVDRRLYMHCRLSIDEYVERWSGPDRDGIRRWPNEEVPSALWPWLVERGYANPNDDDIEWFLSGLGNRPADMRPGIALRRAWPTDYAEEADDRGQLVEDVRGALSEVLARLDEPPLARANAGD